MSVQDLLNYLAIQDPSSAFSKSVTEDIDGTVLERLEYIANRAGGNPLAITGTGYFVLPAGPSVGSTIAAGSDAYSTYTEYSASLGADTLFTHVIIEDVASGVTYLQLAIGVGAAASEVVKSTIRIGESSSSNAAVKPVVPLAIPIKVASGSRVAIKAACNSAQNVVVTLIGVAVSDIGAA